MSLLVTCEAIKASRDAITQEQLVAMRDPQPSFEAHVVENGVNHWIYTVREADSVSEGSTLNGNLICVQASSPNHAEQLAHDGLLDSVQLFSDYLSAGAEVVTDLRPATH